MAIHDGQVDSLLPTEKLQEKYMGKLVRISIASGTFHNVRTKVGVVTYVGHSVTARVTVMRLNGEDYGSIMRYCQIEIWED